MRDFLQIQLGYFPRGHTQVDGRCNKIKKEPRTSAPGKSPSSVDIKQIHTEPARKGLPNKEIRGVDLLLTVIYIYNKPNHV